MGPRRVAVAASGGRDSTALLHCTAKAAAGLGLEVVALHVHHGLQAAADDWLQQVRQQARRWGVGFDAVRLDGRPPAGLSVEAWARRERYRALGAMARSQGCSLVLLAHHRRDQAETFLLQALRGSGAKGLSAMPGTVERSGLTWARPWLDQPREAIVAYVRRHRLVHVDDTSNSDPRFARNALRLSVWPALTAAFAQAETALAAAAGHAQQAAALADEIAALDLPPLLSASALDMAAWATLPPARRRNALAAWLAQALSDPTPDSLVQRLVVELPMARSARWPAPGGELRLYRGRLQFDPQPELPVSHGQASQAIEIDLSQPGAWPLASWNGHFIVEPSLQGGAPAAQLRGLRAVARSGGERLRLARDGLPRSLKKQYQARAVPAWARAGPLLFTADHRLLFAPGLGIDAALQATAGAPQLALRWQPGPAEQGQAGP